LLRRILLTVTALSLLVPLLSFAAAQPALAQSGPPSVALADVVLSDSERSKIPDLDVYGPTSSVVVAGNARGRDALFWEKADTAAAFSPSTVLGAANGAPDYATAAVAYADDGTLYYAWGDISGRSLFMRSRAPGASAFGPAVFVSASYFPSEVKVVTTRIDGVKTIFLFWREAAGEIRYVRSQGEGLPGTWTPSTRIVNSGSFLEISASAGPNGQVVVGYTLPGGNDGALKAWGSFWNGSGFTPILVSPPTNGPFAEPSFALKPDGAWAVAYRGVEKNGNFGAYYAEQQPDGTWPILLRDRGDINSQSLVFDAFGNAHLYYSGIPQRTGRMGLYYAHKRVGEASFAQALQVPITTGFVSAPSAAVHIRGQALAHAAFESFPGDTAVYRYALVTLPLNIISVDGVAIENNRAFSNQTTVRVAFSGIVGQPTRVRYRWGSPPTASDPTVPFDPATPTVNIPAPEVGTVCTVATLYAQLEADNTLPSPVVQDAIAFDLSVQATVRLVGGPAGYDPAATGQNNIRIEVSSPEECAGLDRILISGPVDGAPITRQIDGEANFSTEVLLTGGQGEKTLQITLVDELDNSTLATPYSIIYDTTAPVQTSPGTLTISPEPNGTILYRIELSDAAVTDSGSGLYGLVVTSRVTPQSGTPTTGTPVVVPFSTMRSVSNSNGRVSLTFVYSVLSGLPPAARVPGTYRITARFVDRAGNLAVANGGQPAFEHDNIVLTEIVLPRTHLPLMRR
jgi:hypothetical protein